MGGTSAEGNQVGFWSCPSKLAAQREHATHPGALRILVVANGISAVLDRARARWPILLHGLDATVWRFVAQAAERRWSTRVGLEDGSGLAAGTLAASNVALVTAAIEVFQRRARSLKPRRRPGCFPRAS